MSFAHRAPPSCRGDDDTSRRTWRIPLARRKPAPGNTRSRKDCRSGREPCIRHRRAEVPGLDPGITPPSPPHEIANVALTRNFGAATGGQDDDRVKPGGDGLPAMTERAARAHEPKVNLTATWYNCFGSQPWLGSLRFAAGVVDMWRPHRTHQQRCGADHRQPPATCRPRVSANRQRGPPRPTVSAGRLSDRLSFRGRAGRARLAACAKGTGPPRPHRIASCPRVPPPASRARPRVADRAAAG